MNPQERDQLTLFLKQLADARIADKHAEADTLIRETVAKQPDAAYLLVQRAMLVEQALNTAKAQIAQLQNQVQALQNNAPTASRSGGFLGGNPWAQGVDGGASPAGVPGAAGYQTPRAGAPFNAMPAAPAAAPAGGGVGSFLGSVATTAAGVVAGSFLFQGIENLLGHHSSSPSFWGDSGAGEHVSEQTIINNYYENPADSFADNSNEWSQQDNVADFLADDEDADDSLLGDGGDDSSWT
jgi:hypothetical protein